MHGILGGRWKRRYASRTEAHGESRGYATGRYSGRASALPDRVAWRTSVLIGRPETREAGGRLLGSRAVGILGHLPRHGRGRTERARKEGRARRGRGWRREGQPSAPG